jgi:hypothetical protein
LPRGFQTLGTGAPPIKPPVHRFEESIIVPGLCVAQAGNFQRSSKVEDINHEIKAKMSEIFNRCDGDLVDILFLAAKLELSVKPRPEDAEEKYNDNQE